MHGQTAAAVQDLSSSDLSSSDLSSSDTVWPPLLESDLWGTRRAALTHLPSGAPRRRSLACINSGVQSHHESVYSAFEHIPCSSWAK